MNNLSVKVLPEAQRSLAFGSISGTYAAIGSAFAHPIRIMFLQNLTDQAMQFSFDGSTNHFPLPANGFLLMDVTSNTTINGGAFNIAKGTTVYVKQIVAPGTGAVYLSVFYADVRP